MTPYTTCPGRAPEAVARDIVTVFPSQRDGAHRWGLMQVFSLAGADTQAAEDEAIRQSATPKPGRTAPAAPPRPKRINLLQMPIPGFDLPGLAPAFDEAGAERRGAEALKLMARSAPLDPSVTAQPFTDAMFKRAIQDPRYHRDREPALVDTVRSAWQALYPGPVRCDATGCSMTSAPDPTATLNSVGRLLGRRSHAPSHAGGARRFGAPAAASGFGPRSDGTAAPAPTTWADAKAADDRRRRAIVANQEAARAAAKRGEDAFGYRWAGRDAYWNDGRFHRRIGVSDTFMLARSPGQSGSSAGDLDDRVICTELARQGLLEPRHQRLDAALTRAHLTPAHVRGYHAWAKPYVRLMRRGDTAGRLATALIAPLARAAEIAFRLGAAPRGSRLGAVLRLLGEPVCYGLGLWLTRRRWARGLAPA